MVKSMESGSAVAPFLLKCYEMVNDDSTNDLISWSQSEDSFIIFDDSKFSSELLPKYFKHSNFSSFIRQLNIYGFRKIDTDRWEFANDGFIKGNRRLLKNIVRRKQAQGQSQKKSSQQNETNIIAPREDRSGELWKEVESLKIDKNVLMQELIKLRQHQQTSQSKLVVLREQIKGMEKNQQQMLSFLVMAMQSPGFLVQLVQPKENNWRMAETGKTMLSQVGEDCEPVPIDKAIIRYQPPTNEAAESLCTTNASDPEERMELDLTSDEMKDLFMNIDFLPGSFDEKLLPMETPGPFVLSDIPDSDGMLEQLLLSSPLLEGIEAEERDTEAATGAGQGTEASFHPTDFIDLKSMKDNMQNNDEAVAIETQPDEFQNLEGLLNRWNF